MEVGEVEAMVSELELRLERLRSLYAQYFAGIEKLEPQVVRKDFDRRMEVLRKTQIRNTGIRFRFQTVIQRYNTYQTYWLRICRQIENGTYKRDLRRANARFGSEEPIPPEMFDAPPIEAPSERALPAQPADISAPRQGATPAASPPPVPAAARAAGPNARGNIFELSDGFDLDLSLDAAFDSLNAPAPSRPAGAAPPPTASRAPAPPPAPSAPSSSSRMPAAAAPPGASVAPQKRIVITRAAAGAPSQAPARPDAAAATRPPVPSAAPSAPSVTAPPPYRGDPASRPANVSPIAAERQSVADVSAPRQGATRAAPSGPSLPAPTGRQAPAPPVSAPAPASVAGLPDERVRQIYSRYVDTKRANGESTASVTYDGLAKSLRDSSAKLRDKVGAGKNIDFEVAVKDGKTILRPVVK